LQLVHALARKEHVELQPRVRFLRVANLFHLVRGEKIVLRQRRKRRRQE
jgi:hypothetical protein